MERRKSKKSIFVFIGLLLICLSAYFIAGTFARYQSTATANATVSIAKWSVSLNGTDITTQTSVVNPQIEWQANAYVADGKIAPGRAGSFTIEINPSGSEVAIDYVFSIDKNAITGIIDPASKIDVASIRYTLGLGEQQSVSPSASNPITFTIPQSLSSVLSGDKATVVVTVEWDNDNDAHNSADTINGLSGDAVVVPVSILAKQHITGD